MLVAMSRTKLCSNYYGVSSKDALSWERRELWGYQCSLNEHAAPDLLWSVWCGGPTSGRAFVKDIPVDRGATIEQNSLINGPTRRPSAIFA